MKNSKRNVLVVDDEAEKEDIVPIARVFTRGLPEWTCDVTNYLSKYFPQQASAISCDLHGYLALPVFDSTACVGVIEILTSLEYLEFAYEVQQVYNALKVSILPLKSDNFYHIKCFAHTCTFFTPFVVFGVSG